MCEAAEPGSVVTLKPFLNLGSSDLVVCGPSIVADHQGFVPAPINTDKVSGTARGEEEMRLRASVVLAQLPV